MFEACLLIQSARLHLNWRVKTIYSEGNYWEVDMDFYLFFFCLLYMFVLCLLPFSSQGFYSLLALLCSFIPSGRHASLSSQTPCLAPQSVCRTAFSTSCKPALACLVCFSAAKSLFLHQFWDVNLLDPVVRTYNPLLLGIGMHPDTLSWCFELHQGALRLLRCVCFCERVFQLYFCPFAL